MRVEKLEIRQRQEKIQYHMTETAMQRFSLDDFIDGMKGGDRNLYSALWRGETLVPVKRRGGQ